MKITASHSIDVDIEIRLQTFVFYTLHMKI